MVEYSATMPRFSAASPKGRSRSISSVFWFGSCASATAKLHASVVTPAPPLAPMKVKQPSGCLLGADRRGAGHRPAGRCAHQRLRHDAMLKRQGQKLARPGAHAAHQQVGIGLRRVDHHRRRAVGADALHQFQGILRIGVQVDDDDVVVLLQQPGHIVQAGRIGTKRADLDSRAPSQRAKPPLCGAARRDR